MPTGSNARIFSLVEAAKILCADFKEPVALVVGSEIVVIERAHAPAPAPAAETAVAPRPRGRPKKVKVEAPAPVAEAPKAEAASAETPKAEKKQKGGRRKKVTAREMLSDALAKGDVVLADLVAAGGNRNQLNTTVHRELKAGRLERVSRGVYRAVQAAK